MKAQFIFVPPGGGETEAAHDFDVPVPPSAGNYISIDEGNGTSDFIVRRTWWFLSAEKDFESRTISMIRPGDPPPIEPLGHTARVIVECEYALGRTSCDEHKEACEMFRKQGKPLQTFDATCY